MTRLESIARKLARTDKRLAAYTDYQTIQTDYVVRQQAPKADFEKIQEWYHEALSDFAKRYPKTNESALAMLQLALSKEFEEKENRSSLVLQNREHRVPRYRGRRESGRGGSATRVGW